jgi:methanethiol S-methyltransferase
MHTSNHSYAAYLLLGFTCLVGGGSLIAFMVFLFVGPFNLIDLGLDQSTLLGVDAGLSLLFFLQHSGMVRKSFREWMARFTREEWGDALYAIASGVALSLVIVFWQRSNQTLPAPGESFRWFFRTTYLLSLAGFAWGAKALEYFDPFGRRAILDHLRGRQPRQTPFVIKGPYRWVRHPLYLFFTLMIWSSPDLTADRLLFNLLWTLWIVIGAVLEERDLVATFGDRYREYQQRVPMLIPHYMRSHGKLDIGLAPKGAARGERQ